MPTVPDDVDLDELKAEQERLAEQVRFEDELPAEVRVVAGFDAAYGEDRVHGALAFVELETLEPVVTVTASAPLELPYIPGLLAYRELPALEAVWDEADRLPDVLLVDGGGRIHPRGFGSACHAGIRFDVPSIGVAKSLLLGEIHGAVSSFEDRAPVRANGQLLGYAYLSSRRAKNPIYVSAGHRVSPETALQLVDRACTGERKLPAPIHRAHVAAGEARDAARG